MKIVMDFYRKVEYNKFRILLTSTHGLRSLRSLFIHDRGTLLILTR